MIKFLLTFLFFHTTLMADEQYFSLNLKNIYGYQQTYISEYYSLPGKNNQPNEYKSSQKLNNFKNSYLQLLNVSESLTSLNYGKSNNKKYKNKTIYKLYPDLDDGIMISIGVEDDDFDALLLRFKNQLLSKVKDRGGYSFGFEFKNMFTFNKNNFHSNFTFDFINLLNFEYADLKNLYARGFDLKESISYQWIVHDFFIVSSSLNFRYSKFYQLLDIEANFEKVYEIKQLELDLVQLNIIF